MIMGASIGLEIQVESLCRHNNYKNFCAYKIRSSNAVGYFCHRLGYISIYCEDVKCYLMVKRVTLLDIAQ